MRVAVAGSVLAVAVAAHGRSAVEQAQQMLQRMSLDEKILLLHGSPMNYTGGTPEIVNTSSGVRIPPLNLNDGPQGYRVDGQNGAGATTCWPSSLTVGATFDRALVYSWGQAMGKEFFDKGANVQLGPGLCLARVPVNGRNFEYISGEDPFLGFTLSQPLINGIQSQNVIANAKHFIMNNQETNRGGMTAAVDERTRFEMYYPPFDGATRAGVGSVMCSYNKIQTDGLNEYGDYSCENDATLMRDFKGRMGFTGWVMSDWGATHSTSIMQGLDQEMPGNGSMGLNLKEAVLGGDVPQAAIDESVLRILTPMYKFGIFDHYEQWTNTSRRFDNVTSKAHSKLARNLSASGTVVLKNNGILPIVSGKIKSIAVLGQNGGSQAIVHGDGSGFVSPDYVVSPFAGLLSKFIPKNEKCSFVNNSDYWVQPSSESQNVSTQGECCSLCFSQFPSCQYFTFTGTGSGGGGCWLHPPGGQFQNHQGYVSGSCVDSNSSSMNVTYDDGKDLASAVALAKASDLVLVFVGTKSSEGSDRVNLSFPLDQTALVQAVSAVAKAKTVVVAIAPGAVLMPWVNNVAAALTVFMPGLEFGNAIADVLVGDVNPTGRLPLTFPNVENEVNFTKQQYPGINTISVYSERLEVGYRYYNAKNLKPAFPFGHGLSYTSFAYSNIDASPASVSIDITNTGSRPGADIPQLYLGFPPSAGEPPKQLKGFEKTPLLAPGQKVNIKFGLTDRDLSIWDTSTHAWSKQEGIFSVFVGASSEDIRATSRFTVSV